MSEPFLGEIRTFGFNFAPTGWAMCNGQTMSIAQNQALFSLLGTTYGGDGIQTFALPNLQSRVPMHFGQGSGLSPYFLGETGGVETVTLDTTQMPAHTHRLSASSRSRTSSDPNAKNPALGGYYDSDATHALGPPSLAGGSQPHENRQPFLALNFCIALQGIFPSRS